MESIKCGIRIIRTAYPKRCPGFGPIDFVTTLSLGITVGPMNLQISYISTRDGLTLQRISSSQESSGKSSCLPRIHCRSLRTELHTLRNTDWGLFIVCVFELNRQKLVTCLTYTKSS